MKTFDVCLGTGPDAHVVATVIDEKGAKKLVACLKSVELFQHDAPSIREVERGYEPPKPKKKVEPTKG